jgi:WD40 repeat protein
MLVLKGHRARVRSLAFSADGTKLASAAGQGTAVSLWGLSRGGRRAFLSGHTARVAVVAFAPCGGFWAVSGPGRSVHLWDLSTRRVRSTLLHKGTVHAPAYAPDGRTLAVAAGRTATLWDTATGAARAALEAHARIVTGVAFTADGRLLASAGADGLVKLWEADGGRECAAFDWKVGPVRALALAPDGMRGACGGDTGDLVVWDVDV